ncbi:hypothetical protein BDV19DRAFT_395593 [Aspergillus venezuelensis]
MPPVLLKPPKPSFSMDLPNTTSPLILLANSHASSPQKRRRREEKKKKKKKKREQQAAAACMLKLVKKDKDTSIDPKHENSEPEAAPNSSKLESSLDKRVPPASVYPYNNGKSLPSNHPMYSRQAEAQVPRTS